LSTNKDLNLVHTIFKAEFLLSYNKCIFWSKNEILILSDLHLGKASHFRKNGISVTNNLIEAEFENLEKCIATFQPKKVIIVGDLFHSYANNEVELFGTWIKKNKTIQWHLVKGNHDILKEEVYKNLGLQTHLQLQIDDIVFAHQPPIKFYEKLYYITGHVHPAIKVPIGKTKQKSLPCFFFGQQHAILPSFGLFTGNYTIKPSKKDVVYAITANSVIKI
jgi:DNA ligase-associated metallophosphoesterase